MATTRLQLQTAIYAILAKSSTAYGLLDPTKVNSAIQDALDYIATLMNNSTAMWLAKDIKLNIVGNDPTVTLPTDCVIINFVKKLQFGTQYTPIVFDESSNTTTDTNPQNTANYTPTYRLSGGELYLEPTPADSLTNGIWLNYVAAPAALSGDSSALDISMDYPVFVQFVKWRAASILWSLTQDQTGMPPWANTETIWYNEVKRTIAKRIAKPAFIQGMTDY
jgi:hypothetical protein